MNKDVFFFMFGTTLTLFGVYAVGYFITLNEFWFYTTTIGRIIAVVLFFVVVSANVKALSE